MALGIICVLALTNHLLGVSQPGPWGHSQPSVLTTGHQPIPTVHSSTSSHQSFSWSPANSPLIKHIPKSAFPACMFLLAKLFHEVSTKPGIAKNWLAVLNWGLSIPNVPKLGGKRYIISVIKKRIASHPKCCS